MLIVTSIVAVLLYTALVLLEAGRAARTSMSLFELRRRRAAKDGEAADILRREELVAQAGMLKAPLRALLIVALAFLVTHILGLYKGLAVVVVGLLLYGRIADISVVRRLAGRLYAKGERRFLAFIAAYGKSIRLVTGRAALSQPTAPLESREELAHLLDVSHIFTSEDKKLMESVLRFSDYVVGDVMTKKDALVTVRPDELLGPLVLDDLHKTKHELFPVDSNGEIVGMLDIRDHVALRRKESVYARDVMNGGVVRILETEPLDEALRVLIAAKQPYLIVMNDDGQAVGMVGLGDMIRALTGWSRR